MVKIKILEEGLTPPQRKSRLASGYDLYCPANVTIRPGRNLVKMGFMMSMEQGLEAQIRPRSGFSLKGMEGYNTGDTDFSNPKRFDADVILGTIDADYRGEVGTIIKSVESVPFVIKEGTRISQMVICKVDDSDYEITDNLDDTDRGDGGFGHSGTAN